jgi:hypothetical protein
MHTGQDFEPIVSFLTDPLDRLIGPGAGPRYFLYVYRKSQWLAPCMMVWLRSSLRLGS